MKILLLGGHGRLGQKISQKFIEQNVNFEIIERHHTNSSNNFYNFLNNQLETNQKTLLLDVSLSESTHNITQYLLDYPSIKNTLHFMVGTTGHSLDCLNALNELSNLIPLCIVPNFSKGIFLFSEILNATLSNGQTLKQLAQALGFHIELTDIHHRHKKDSPSGTAKLLNQALELPEKNIISVREGEVVGTHSLVLKTPHETLDITHNVTERNVFAEGAYDLAIRFLSNNSKPGMYSPAHLF